MDMDPLVKSNVWYWIPDMDEVKAITKKYLQSEGSQATPVVSK